MKLPALFLLCILYPKIYASPGDQLDEFMECNDVCRWKQQCMDAKEYNWLRDSQYASVEFSQPSLLYRILWWDCYSECDYQCQQIVTRDLIAQNKEILQFHGKWPFVRLFGAQELLSTAFSMGNLIPHYKAFHTFYRELSLIPSDSNLRPLLINYMLVALAGMLAWTFSSIFHTRDLFITEKLDYFFAGAAVLTAFHAIFVRIMRFDRYPRARRLFSAIVVTIFALHIIRLYLDWSYTYNIRFNVFFGLLQYVFLVVLAFQNKKTIDTRTTAQKSSVYVMNSKTRQNLFWEPIFVVLYSIVALSCELRDFFNYSMQIDSHAIWHALTIVPTIFLYKIFLTDFRYLHVTDGYVD